MQRRWARRAPSEELHEGPCASTSVQRFLAVPGEEPALGRSVGQAAVGKARNLVQRAIAELVRDHVHAALEGTAALQECTGGEGRRMSRSEQLGFRPVGHLRFSECHVAGWGT